MGRQSKITEIEIRIGKPITPYLTEALKAGKKPPEIASEMGVTLSTTYNLINQLGLKSNLKEAGKQVLYARKSGELKETIDEYLRAKEIGQRSSKTISNYKDALYGFLWWLDDNKKPTALAVLNPQTLRDFFYYLQTTPERFGGKTTSARRLLQPSTLRAYYIIFRAFGNWLVLQERLEKNPVMLVERPRVPKRLPEDLPDEAIDKILASFGTDFEGIRDRTIIMMFLDTGLRLDGVVNLEASQFDLESGWGKVMEKGDKERRILLSSGMLTQLQEYLARREPVALTNKLWVNESGEHFGRGQIRTMVTRLKRFDRHIHPHIFRHIWAKYMWEANLSIQEVMTMGGWADMELVRHYASAHSTSKAWDGHEKASPVIAALRRADNGRTAGKSD